MFCFKGTAESSLNDQFSEFSMQPFINSNRTSVTNSVFESNYMSEPLYLSPIPSTTACPAPTKMPTISEYSVPDIVDGHSSFAGVCLESKFSSRPSSVAEPPSFNSLLKPKYLSVAQDQFDKLDEEQSLSQRHKSDTFRSSTDKSDTGGAYHCTNCSRRVFDSLCRVSALGMDQIVFVRSEVGSTVTVPAKSNGRFEDLIKCSRCKRQLGVRGKSAEAKAEDKVFIIDSTNVKFRYKTFI